jgi:hypothetical protein
LEQTQFYTQQIMANEELIQRFNFTDIFTILQNESGLSTKQWIEVNGVTYSSGAVGPGWIWGGVNFQLYKNIDIAAELREESGHTVYVIKGFYKN